MRFRVLLFSFLRATLRGPRAVPEPVLTGWRADFTPKCHAEILHVGKARAFGDLFQRQVRLDQQPFHTVESDSQDLFVRCPAKEPFEAAFKERA